MLECETIERFQRKKTSRERRKIITRTIIAKNEDALAYSFKKRKDIVGNRSKISRRRKIICDHDHARRL